MDSNLVSFVRALRSAGAEPSTSETIDAARAVALVGYSDRAELKAALGMALAKSDERSESTTRCLTSTLVAVASSSAGANQPGIYEMSDRTGAYRQHGNRFASQSRHEHFERCGGP